MYIIYIYMCVCVCVFVIHKSLLVMQCIENFFLLTEVLSEIKIKSNIAFSLLHNKNKI